MTSPGDRLELLDPSASVEAIRAQLTDAALTARVEAGEPIVIVVPPFLAREAVARFARRGEVKVHSVVGYPLGWSRPVLKAIEATGLAKENVDAIEVVPLPDVSTLLDELREIVRGVRAARPGLPVIVRVTSVLLRPGQNDVVPEEYAASIVRAIQQGGCDGVVLADTAGVGVSDADHHTEGRVMDALVAATRGAGLTFVRPGKTP